MSALTIYLNSESVGTLEQDSSGMLRFAYRPEWLARADATPLSRMLPLSPAPYENPQVLPFFAGLLPEEGPRKAVARILGISEGNDFAILERLGGECAGAVSLLPEGQQPAQGENRKRVLDNDELVSIVHELPRRPLMAGEEGIRLSLAGAQDKLPVVIVGDSIALPLGNTQSTHIIKPEPKHFPGLVANEALCMELARNVGLNAAETTTRWIGDIPCLVVIRYDRKVGANGMVRLHQEDFCQALGRLPAHKYQQEGGPTVRESVVLLREWSTTPVLDILAFLDALIFNILIGNADAHGKNFSMVYANRRRSLAPLYDLVSTIAWPELSTRLAMNIGHGKHVNDLNALHYKRLAEECGLGWPMVRERVQDLTGRVATAVKDQHDRIQGSTDSKVANNVCGHIAERCERMQR